jgi:arginase family enzyme
MFVVKVPGVNGGDSRGCERAGNAVLDMLKEIHSDERGRPVNADILDLEEIHLDNKNPKMNDALICKNSYEAFEAKPKTVFLGGDHSITYSTARAFLGFC